MSIPNPAIHFFRHDIFSISRVSLSLVYKNCMFDMFEQNGPVIKKVTVENEKQLYLYSFDGNHNYKDVSKIHRVHSADIESKSNYTQVG